MNGSSAITEVDPVMERRALFAAAGLPIPLFDGKPTPTHDSVAYDAKIGVLAHQIIAILAPTVRSLSKDEQRTRIADTVAAVVTSPTLGRLGKARLRVISMVMAYVNLYMPPVDATFLGAELVTGNGRVDLAWSLTGTGVWFDEIKTWRHQRVGLDTATWDQVHRYIDAGQSAFGDDFAGLRVITLSDPAGSVSIDRWGTVEGLVQSVLAPTRLALRGAA